MTDTNIVPDYDPLDEDVDIVATVVQFQSDIAQVTAELEDLKGARKRFIENATADLKPSEFRGFVATIADAIGGTNSQVLKILGEQITRGDVEVYNSEDERIGVLYLADVFSEKDSGVWSMIGENKIRWYMSGEPSGTTENNND